MLAPLLTTVSLAAGLDAPQVGSVDSGPLTADPAALFYNPALLAHVRSPAIMAGGGLVVGRASYTRQRLGGYAPADELTLTSPQLGELDPSRSGAADPVAAYPVAPVGDLFAAAPVGPLTVGFGAFVPYAAVLAWPRDGDQRFALQDTSVIVSNLTAGVGARLGPLSVGGTVGYQLGFGEISRVQDLAGLEYFNGVFGDPPIGQANEFGRAAPSTVREQDTLGRPFAVRRGVSHDLVVHAGVALELGDVLLSGSYSTGSKVEFKGPFSLDMDDAFFTNDVSPYGLEYPRLVTGDGSFSVGVPHRVRLGAALQLGDIQAGLSGSWSDWSTYDATRLTLVSDGFVQEDLGLDDTVPVEVPRRWQPSVGAELSVRHPRFTAAVGYQSPAAPAETLDAASVDGHRLLARGGARLPLAETLGLWLGGNLQGILPRDVTNSDHDLGNGRYTLVIGTLSAHLTYAAR